MGAADRVSGGAAAELRKSSSAAAVGLLCGFKFLRKKVIPKPFSFGTALAYR